MALIIDAINSLLARRSLENPSTPLSAPDDWLFDSLGSFRASSGVNINRETALTYDAYWRCCNLISGDVAKLPLYIFRKTIKGKVHALEHPAYPLLRHKANDEIVALIFKRVLTFHGLAEGNGYAYIFRNRDGTPRELLPLSPMKTYPIRENNVLWYVTEIGQAEQRRLPASDVFHLKGLSFDGLVGYSVISKMRESLGLGLAAQNFGSIFFRNNARPNVVIRHPGKLSPEAKTNLRESWERIHVGLENAHRTAILEEGMEAQTLMHNARDSQLLELRSFNRIEVANFFGVPPHKVGDNSRTSYNSLEQENEAYLEDGHGLGYWLKAWEAEAYDKLLSTDEKASHKYSVEFNRAELLRANLQARTQYYVSAITYGWLSPNEVRSQEGLNPRTDGHGDSYLQQLNLTEAGAAKPETVKPPLPSVKPETVKPPLPSVQPKPKRALLEQAQVQILRTAVTRLIKRIGIQAQKAAKVPANFLPRLDKFAKDQALAGRRMLQAPLRALLLVRRPEMAANWRPVLPINRLLLHLRNELLELSGSCRAEQLAVELQALLSRWDQEGGALMQLLLRARVDQPARSVDEALDILDRLPSADTDGRIPVLFPVNDVPPFDIKPRDLKGKTTIKAVKVRRLTAMQPLVKRDLVAKFVRNPGRYQERGAQMDGMPTDLCYVVRAKGENYIYDGHHRMMGRNLLGVTRTRVYFADVADI